MKHWLTSWRVAELLTDPRDRRLAENQLEQKDGKLHTYLAHSSAECMQGDYPAVDQLFSIYESYNYNIPTNDPKFRYGYARSIQAIPLSRASQEQRISDFTIGEDDTYCYIYQ